MAPLLYLRSDDGKTARAQLYSHEDHHFAAALFTRRERICDNFAR
jgi:hypothetical protein